jgi:hypothetical protein
MATVTKTAPTFSVIESPVVIASGSVGTNQTLDLKTKIGAWLYIRMGRRLGTALTRAAYVLVRRSDNDTLVLPAQTFDVISQTATAQSTTVSTASAIGDQAVVLASIGTFAIGDTICLHSEGTGAYTPDRVEFARIINIATNTITVERPLRTAHSIGDRVTNLADVRQVYIPGGDIYEIRCINTSGQPIVFAVDAATDGGETIT